MHTRIDLFKSRVVAGDIFAKVPSTLQYGAVTSVAFQGQEEAVASSPITEGRQAGLTCEVRTR